MLESSFDTTPSRVYSIASIWWYQYCVPVEWKSSLIRCYVMHVHLTLLPTFVHRYYQSFSPHTPFSHNNILSGKLCIFETDFFPKDYYVLRYIFVWVVINGYCNVCLNFLFSTKTFANFSIIRIVLFNV